MITNGIKIVIDIVLMFLFCHMAKLFTTKITVIKYIIPETLSKFGVVLGYVTYIITILILVILIFDIVVYLATYFAEKREAKLQNMTIKTPPTTSQNIGKKSN